MITCQDYKNHDYMILVIAHFQSCLIGTKDTLSTQEIPVDLGTVSGTRVRDQILEQKILLAPYHLGDRKGFRSQKQRGGGG